MTPRHDPVTFAGNMAKVAASCQAAWQEFLRRHPGEPGKQASDMVHIATAFTELWARMLADPQKFAEMQLQLWQNYLLLWQHSAGRFLGKQGHPVITPDPKDRRFKDAAWQENTLFDFIKQSYLLTSRWMLDHVQQVEGIDQHTAHKIDFYTRQFVDAISPSNFWLTNPEVLRATMESDGENLVKGFQNLLQDLEKSNGHLRIRMTDMEAFEVGRNLALTPGKVVYQNDLMQLIQYAPATAQVYRTPLLVIPAWINKYYILDLQPENSLVKWLVSQGHTVFVISWVNPDARHAKKTFDDYLLEGPLAAMDAIEQATGEKEISVMAYCLGGTLLAILLSYLQAKKAKHRIKSATYLTTMVDFSDAGDLAVFIDEAQLTALEQRMAKSGYLDGGEMASTFSLLRANDLIWSFVVNNYLLGKTPFPFDLLYWNADSTRMPAQMHSFYLRSMYQKNLLMRSGGISVADVPVDLRRVTTPAYILSAREDHIAPWQATYTATQIYQGEKQFVLAASGHIAGVINPPAKEKYCYWTNPHTPASPDAWLADAKETPGSWWPHWQAWQRAYAGEKVNARQPGDGKLKVIEAAPGSYVKVK